MRLSEIQLKTFRSYVNVALNLDAPRVLISGVNGSGKTSIRDAIAWSLTGKTPEMSGKTAIEDLVPTFAGASKVQASVVLKDGPRVEREWRRDGSALHVTNWTGNLTEQQAALYEHLSTSEAVVHVLCDARAFLRLEHADAKALLLSLLNVTVEAPTSGFKGPFEKMTLEQLDAAYQTAFEDRKIAKRRVQQHLVPNEPVSPVVYKSIEDYERRLSELRTELGAMERSIGETAGKRALLKQQRQRLDDQRFGLDRPDIVAHLEASIETLRGRLAAFPDDAAVPGSVERMTFLKGRIDALMTHKPDDGCVMDKGVPCKTPGSKFTKVWMEYQREVDAMPPEGKPSQRKTLENELRSDEVRFETFKRNSEFNAKLDEDIAKVDADIAALPDTSAEEQAIQLKREHIKKGESITADARKYSAARDVWATATREHQKLVDDVERLEYLCDALGPKGVRVKALESAVGTFLALVNPYMKPFGWTLEFRMDPWGTIVNNRPVQTYSASERYRIGVGLQLAIAQASGLSFAVVDELDILDIEGNRQLGKLLYYSPLEQIIILRTRNADDPLPKMPMNVIGYRLGSTDGRSSVLEKIEGQKVTA